MSWREWDRGTDPGEEPVAPDAPIPAPMKDAYDDNNPEVECKL